MSVTGPMKYLTIGDSTYEIYNTDTKVTQTYATASGYTYWRPLVVGYSSGSAETSTPATTTNTTYVFDTIKVKPSDGIIRFGAAALYDGNYTTTISADTLTAARTVTVPDKSGVMALTSDIPDVSGYAPLASPTFTGIPTAPTPGQSAGDTEIATVKYVQDAVSGAGTGTGTVTSVGLSNATNGGLSISGSPITSSGSITVGHINVLTSAQTTQAVYPIKIDKNGHISAYGAAVSIPTKTSDLINDSGFISSYTETDPVFSASPAAGITSTDISNWNSIVSDDKTWNGVELDKVGTTYGQSSFIPGRTSTSATTAYQIEATTIPNSYRIVKWDNDKYLYATTPSANDNSTKVATTAYVDSAITALPEPMIFKGSLGTGGTITSLPAASSSNEGFTYKVITAGTYASQSAKIGDTFISDGNNWILIPSGDEPSGTVTSITAGVGLTTADGNPITSSGTIKIKLNSETSLGTIGSTSKLYAVGVDSNGQLGVKVPWANDQVYTIKSSSSYVDMFLTGSTSSDTSTGYLYKDPSARLKVSDSSGETGLFLGDDITEGEKLGAIYLYSQSGIYTRLTALATTMVKYISLPDKTGIIALTDDIPSISLNGSSTTSASFYAPTTAGTSGYYLKSNGSGAPTWTAITVPTKTSDLTNDSGFITGMTILSYGSSTWNDFLTAYNANKVVYCRASSNSNPATGSQTRLAFMAYVNDATSPTTVEFQYYRSVNTHTESQQGDQVYVYTLTSAGSWSVTAREASVKVVAGTGLGGTYSNGTMTLTGPTISLNGSSTTSASFYAPTDAGTSGQVLTSNGSGAPTWAAASGGTDEKLAVAAVTSGTTYYPIVGTGTAAATRQFDTTGFSYSANSIRSFITLGNNISEGTTGSKRGAIQIYGTADRYTQLETLITSTGAGQNTGVVVYFPDKGGTVALTSDITDEKLKWTASTSSNTYYPLVSTSTATTSTANTLNGIDFYQYYSTTGGYRRLNLGNSTSWKSTGGAYGTIRLYGAAATYYGDLVPGVLGTTSGDGHISANRTWTLPDKTGTIALTSDIPTVPTITLNGSTTTTPSFYAPTSAGTSGQVLTSSGSGAPTWNGPDFIVEDSSETIAPLATVTVSNRDSRYAYTDFSIIFNGPNYYSTLSIVFDNTTYICDLFNQDDEYVYGSLDFSDCPFILYGELSGNSVPMNLYLPSDSAQTHTIIIKTPGTLSVTTSSDFDAAVIHVLETNLQSVEGGSY